MIKSWLPSLFFLPIILFLISNRGDFIPILDHFNLLIHEGGHGIFSIFNDFIYTLGGSLMQIIIPLLFIFYSYTNRKRIALRISLIFLGENLMNIGRYVADARSQTIPLLGGKNVYHDWTYILSRINMLEYDHTFETILFIIACILFLITLILPLIMYEGEIKRIELL